MPERPTGLTKPPGEPKEADAGIFGAAATAFDVAAYVDDFNRDILGAYRLRGGDAGPPAGAAVARSVIPPGTAATRDFSSLAPQLPAFDFEACVGCMTCVNVCPDTAILAVA